MTAQAGNDALLMGNSMGLEDDDDLYKELLPRYTHRFDSDGCLALINPGGGDVMLFIATKERLHGSIPCAAPLDVATARALHVVAGASRDAATALHANSSLRASHVGDSVFAVVNHAGSDEKNWGEGVQLESLWRSGAEAEQEAQRLTEEAEWRRKRGAARHGCCTGPSENSGSSNDKEGAGGGAAYHEKFDVYNVASAKVVCPPS
ncbi:hypothetical protein JKP88DRAFT_332329 [Tribonema minus]|uniref:Uncharacterized protein n=1 Tax=Tribonema minus TaxID=303371 RepID=A0A836CAN0_9STRA|nr:hypothetical protein JKP88DRAFT_332329 [Tribonema minus]